MNNNDALKQVCKEFLKKDEPQDVYMGFRFAFVWAMIDEKFIDDDEFQAWVREKVAINKSRLKACREYNGKNFTDGLYGDMCEMNQKLVDTRHVSLIW